MMQNASWGVRTLMACPLRFSTSTDVFVNVPFMKLGTALRTEVFALLKWVWADHPKVGEGMLVSSLRECNELISIDTHFRLIV